MTPKQPIIDPPPKAYTLGSGTFHIKIVSPNGDYLQSYGKTIAFIEIADQQIYLDRYYHNYSTTTIIHRNKFLGLSSDEINNLIESGEIILTEMN